MLQTDTQMFKIGISCANFIGLEPISNGTSSTRRNNWDEKSINFISILHSGRLVRKIVKGRCPITYECVGQYDINQLSFFTSFYVQREFVLL